MDKAQLIETNFDNSAQNLNTKGVWKPRRILAVKLDALGDALLTTPALRAIKATYPTAQLEVLTAAGGPALAGLPYIDRVLNFDKHSYDNPREALKPANLAKALKFALQLACARYDAVIFFHHFTLAFGALKFAGLGLATLAPLRVGLDNGLGRAWFLNRRVKDEGFGAKNEREYWLELAGAIGAKLPEGDDGRPELFVSKDAKARAQELWAKIDNGKRPVVAIGPGGGNYSLARRWLPVGFAKVADGLVKQFDAKIVIMGSSEEIGLGQEIRGLMTYPEAVTIIAGETRVDEAVAFLENCALFIANDGGLTHLAAVAKTPSVVLFGPSNAMAWRPFGEKVAVVQASLDLPCRPCLYRGKQLGSRYGCAPRPCLTAITPAQVLEVAEQLINSR